jgi:transcriptional regulator with XRE-family HTH domain
MKLKELMAQKRWNITSFAKALHKSRCTVWNWCNGHYLPNVTDIKAMAELLEVPVEEVVNCFV